MRPRRVRPIAIMMHPEITARHEAMTCPGISGSDLAAFATICPVRVDMTATGYENQLLSMSLFSKHLHQ